ncbi:MAG: AAA family ATPase [Pseudonocardiaceae bacterium]
MLVERAYIHESSRPESYDSWPYTVPCVAELAEHGLTFDCPITFLVGENGSGKSTIVEALAEAFKFDDRGGRNLGPYATNRPKTPLGSVLQLDLTARGSAVLRGPRSKRRGFFLRAETAFGLMDAKSGTRGYWDENTSEMSHGESFFTVFSTMFQDPLLYLMDEPEAALSFTSCLRLVGLMHQLGQTGAQIICATHSPILAATPGADIIEIGDHGSRQSEWRQLELVSHWSRYMENPDLYLRHVTAEQ